MTAEAHANKQPAETSEYKTFAGRLDIRVIRSLMPFLWSANGFELRARVVIALAMLVVAIAANVGVPLVYKEAVDALTPGKELVLALPLAMIGAYGLLRLVSVASGEIRDAIFAKVTQRAIRTVARRVFEHLHRLSMRFHLDRQTGGLSRAIERGTKGIEFTLAFMLFSIIPTIVEILVVCAILWALYNFWFALVTFITIGSYILFTLMITEWRLRFRREMNARDQEASTRAIDSLLNFETVKYFGNEDHEARRYDSALARYEIAAVKNKTSLSLLNVGQSAIIAGGLTGVMVMAGMGVTAGTMTLGDFVLVVTYLMQLYLPLGFLGYVYREVKQSLTDMEAMFDLVQVPPDVTDREGAAPLVLSGGEVVFDDVSFGYRPDRPIIKHVSFRVPAGRKVAIVGPSGAGKSTISRLLFRFYDVDGGAISIDGQDLRDITQDSLRRAIGIVPQDTVLFNDTIEYNIAYGRPGAADEDIKAAARLAAIHDFIASTPDGYQTRVGERGLKLSGGEKQRVAIARTMLKRPTILVFDEATSALDSRTEKEIQAALRAVSVDHTTLVIAHRLSTVIDADEIIVLDNGAIVERGTHQALLDAAGTYAAMWARQQEAAQLKEALTQELGVALAQEEMASEGLSEQDLKKI
ncbi:MAG: ABC transporter ATP-binding protein/permease [Alphaproteobacteria bacterium]|nr:MAG: ABC transporter ATP-binding protein/permease [Alphaproteobacteria bacterium]